MEYKQCYNYTMGTFDKLKIRIKKDLDLNLENFARQYVGHWQRSRGAWVWTANEVDSISTFGGCESATELLKSKNPLILRRDYAGFEIMSK